MRSLQRKFKDLMKGSLRTLFELGQRAGFDVLPRHFYSEIPDLAKMRGEDHWKLPFSMVGIEGAEAESQLRAVREWVAAGRVVGSQERRIHEEAILANGEAGYGPIEAELLYAFVAARRPSQIFQVGCGVSTAVCLMAAEDAGYRPEIICVEPYPTEYLLRLAAEGRIKLIQQKVELIEHDIVAGLEADVLFFVDSTHTIGPAGEVSRIILELLPLLKGGASVHFHDITFPYDYDRTILNSALFFPHESALLHAFLAYNRRFQLLASMSMLHYARQRELKILLPSYQPGESDQGLETSPGHFPSAAYLQVTE